MKQAELNLLKANNELQSAFVTLNAAMGRPSVAPYKLQPNVFAANPLSPLETLLEKALSLRPEIQGSQDRLHAAEEAIQAVKALRFGNIGAIGTAGYTWWGHEERPSGKEVSNPGAQLGFWGAGGTSAFPIYSGGRIEGKIDQAQARRGELRATGREIGNDVVLQVAQAYFTQQTVEEQIRVAQERAAHAREALTLANERYKQGLGSILDITTAAAALTGAEVGLAEAQYEAEATFAALRYATGEEYARF
jgi:outer membrane protein